VQPAVAADQFGRHGRVRGIVRDRLACSAGGGAGAGIALRWLGAAADGETVWTAPPSLVRSCAAVAAAGGILVAAGLTEFPQVAAAMSLDPMSGEAIWEEQSFPGAMSPDVDDVLVTPDGQVVALRYDFGLGLVESWLVRHARGGRVVRSEPVGISTFHGRTLDVLALDEERLLLGRRTDNFAFQFERWSLSFERQASFPFYFPTVFDFGLIRSPGGGVSLAGDSFSPRPFPGFPIELQGGSNAQGAFLAGVSPLLLGP
jgi:hypothetical protein